MKDREENVPQPDTNSREASTAADASDQAKDETGSVTRAGEERASTVNECVVVGVGASAGGLEAFKRFLRAVPHNSGLAYVLIPHLDPDHDSIMAQLLGRFTDLNVVEIEDQMDVEPNRVYLIPPNKFLTLRDGKLALEETIKSNGLRLPIDHFFTSLARERAERAICVVLTGTGSDGSVGVREVKAAGGMTMAQEPNSAEYDGMPGAAIHTGCVDVVAEIEEMPAAAVQYARHPYIDSRDQPLVSEGDDALKAVLALLRTRADYDFSSYKKGTLVRRIQRRMGLNQIAEIDDYLEQLRGDQAEVQALFNDMLIGVTRFFRDADTWDAVAKLVAPRIVRDQKTGDPLRIWVPGCSTGEEAFTLAAIFDAEIDKQRRRQLDLLIFATDLDQAAIAKARSGKYSLASVGDLPERYQSGILQKVDDSYQVTRRLREHVVFALQNVITDPPFSNLSVISCRNLLIYLNNDVQQRLMEVFHFALADGGCLILGDSESPGRSELFEPVSKKNRIYRKVGSSQGLPPRSRALLMPQERSLRSRVVRSDSSRKPGISDTATQLLLDRHAPATIVVDPDLQIQYFHGPTGRYLEFPSGVPTLDVTSMALPGLETRLRSAIRKVRETGAPVDALAPRVTRGEETVSVVLRAELLLQQEEKVLVMVSFTDERPAEEQGPLIDLDDDERSINEQLRYELGAMREDHQTTVEELETSNEELKASNEEVMSMNEELQSTNEELETSREELQSLNEELSTINAQLEEKIVEVESTNDDLSNLLSSTRIGTLFLDSSLQIRRFTPAVTELFHLRDADIGRPMADLQHAIIDPDLLEDAREVLQRLSSIEREVETRDERSFLRTILPYRTAKDHIEGVVVTYAEVTELSRSRSLVQRQERQQTAVAQLGQMALNEKRLEPLFQRALDLVVETLDADFGKLLELDQSDETLKLRAHVGWGKSAPEKIALSAGSGSLASHTLRAKLPVVVEDLHTQDSFGSAELLEAAGVRSGISVAIRSGPRPWGVLGVHDREARSFSSEDVAFVQSVAQVLAAAIRQHATLATLAEQRTELEIQFAELEAVYAQVPIGLSVHDADLRFVRINQRLADFNDLRINDSIGHRLSALVPEIGGIAEESMAKALETGKPVENVEISATFGKGIERHYRASYHPITDTDQPRAVIAAVLDVTEDTEAARRSTARYAAAEVLYGESAARDALNTLVDRITESLHFEIGELWLLDHEKRVHYCNHFVVPKNPEQTDELRQLYDEIELSEGTGLPGVAWKRGALVWMDEVAEDDRFKRRSEAMKLGIRTAVAFPVGSQHDEPIGVIALHTARHLERNEPLVELLESIGRSAGHVILRREIQERLERRDAMAREFVRRAPVPVLVCSSDGKIEQVNQRFILETGKSVEDLDSLSDWLESDDPPLFPDAEKGEMGMASFETTVSTLKGRRRWLLYRSRLGGQEEDNRWLLIGLDITERHETERVLEQAMLEAERANRAKSEFLANVSHEIRTPLTAILGYADVLLRQALEETPRSQVLTIKRNGRHLLQVLNDILDLARIEADHLELETVEVAPSSIVADVITMQQQSAKDKGLDLQLNFLTPIPRVIETDPLRLSQTLLNLLANSIKFTDSGHVGLEVEYRPPKLGSQDLNGQLCFHVFDSGIGISDEDAERLFLPFEQADSSDSRIRGGSGLGLAISRRLVHLLGGELSLESKVGQGSRFTIELPSPPVSKEELIDPEPENHYGSTQETSTVAFDLSGHTVLIVDDHPEVRELLATELSSTGARTVEASHGAAALELWRRTENDIDGILLDMQMPAMDGYETAAKLREHGYGGAIVALTASAMAGDRTRCLEAGCDAYETKPINRTSLFTTLRAVLAERGRDPESKPPAATTTTKSKILLVEDDINSRDAMQQLLEFEGFDVKSVGTVDQALATIEGWNPQSILCDAKLPGTSGEALPALLQERMPDHSIQLIALTGLSEADFQQSFQKAGFHAFFEKPVNLRELIETLHHH